MTAPVKQLSDGNPGGTGLGQSATDLISFYGVTPVVQPVTVAAGTDAATTQTCANACRVALRALGLMA